MSRGLHAFRRDRFKTKFKVRVGFYYHYHPPSTQHAPQHNDIVSSIPETILAEISLRLMLTTCSVGSRYPANNSQMQMYVFNFTYQLPPFYSYPPALLTISDCFCFSSTPWDCNFYWFCLSSESLPASTGIIFSNSLTHYFYIKVHCYYYLNLYVNHYVYEYIIIILNINVHK